jgi:hypothetical protein
MFEFGVALYHGQDQDTIRMPRKFAEVLDEQHNQVMLRVRGSATGVWTVKVLFDHVHEIMAGHFLVFNYDREHTLIVMVFDDTM